MVEERKYNWEDIARKEQILPKDGWDLTLILGGMGSGKTRLGSEWIRQKVERDGCKSIALIAPSRADAVHVNVMGESGILNIYKDKEPPKYSPIKNEFVWECGAKLKIHSLENLELMKGEDFSCLYIDEPSGVSSRKYLEDLENLISKYPHSQILITARPIPVKLYVDILKESKTNTRVISRSMSTYDNEDNLSKGFMDSIRKHREEMLREIDFEESSG